MIRSIDRKKIQAAFCKLAALVIVATASAGPAHSEECVQYIKRVRPAYKNVANGNWVYARSLWDLVGNRSRGVVAVVDAILVIDGFGKNQAGHVALVTATEFDPTGKRVARFKVSHANWDQFGRGLVTEGWFTFVDPANPLKGVRYTTIAGVNWNTVYPVRGFVYRPN